MDHSLKMKVGGRKLPLSDEEKRKRSTPRGSPGRERKTKRGRKMAHLARM
jgi:hypothetical protein